MNLGNLNFFKLFIIFIIFIIIFSSKNSYSDNLKGNIVTVGALDKITAKFSEFDIKVGYDKKFGSINIEIIKCFKRPPEEILEDFVLIKITDFVDKDNPQIYFSGWMISSSPSISPLEHPTYDIWVKDCKI